MGTGATEYEQHYIDDKYDEWLQELAEKCLCCPVCWQVPCGGCRQGAMCDEMQCECDHDL